MTMNSDGVSANDAKSHNDTSVYSELDDVRHHDSVSASTTTFDETGYMKPIDDGSPAHLLHHMARLSSPPPSYYNDERQEPTTTVVEANSGYQPPHTYTPMKPQRNNVGHANTDVV